MKEFSVYFASADVSIHEPKCTIEFESYTVKHDEETNHIPMIRNELLEPTQLSKNDLKASWAKDILIQVDDPKSYIKFTFQDSDKAGRIIAT